jgi:hypothetical protein
MRDKLRMWKRLARIIVIQWPRVLLAVVIIVPLYALRWQWNEHDGSVFAGVFYLLPVVAWLILLGLISFGWLLYLLVGTRAVYFPLVMVCATAIAWLLPLPPPPLVRVFLAHRAVFEALVARVQQEHQVTGKHDLCVDIPNDVKAIHWDIRHICSYGLRDYSGEGISFPLFEGVILYRADPTESFDATCNSRTNCYRPIDTHWYYQSNGQQWREIPPDN